MKKIILFLDLLVPVMVFAVNFPCTCSPTNAGSINILNSTVGNFTAEAVPNAGYHFVRWKIIDRNDNVKKTSSDNPFHVPYDYINQYSSADGSFFNHAVAYFEISTYTITTSATSGSIIGGGSYNYGATDTLTAIPDGCHQFSQWSDGNTDNPRTITVTGNATYTAEFTKINYTINGQNASSAGGSVQVVHP